MLKDKVADMIVCLFQVYILIHVINATAGSKLTFQPHNQVESKVERTQTQEQPTATVWGTPHKTLDKPNNQQHLMQIEKPIDFKIGYKLVKPHIYFPNQYLSYKLTSASQKAVWVKGGILPLSHNEDLVVVTQAYATNKGAFPRPVLYKLGFVTQAPSLADIRDRALTGYSDTSNSTDNTTMGHLLIVVMGSFVASLLAISAGTIVFLIRRKKQNSLKEITLPSEGWNKTNIDTVNKEASLRRTGISIYEMNMALTAVPVCPLSDCPAPTGMGQVILQRCNSTYSTHLSLNSKFINQFSDFVGHNGGRISSPQSDVSLEVPSGAVPQGDLQQVFINVSLDGDHFQVCEGQGEVQLSPVVEMATPSRPHWDRPVVLRIPHRALLKDSTWKLKVKMQRAVTAGSEAGSLRQWACLDPSLYSCDGQFIKMHPSGPGLFVVVGKEETPGGPAPLSVCVEAWVNRTASQTNYRLYVCHDIQDIHKRICEMEQVYSGCPISAPVPLTLHRHSPDLQVNMDVCSPTDHKAPIVKTISTELCYQCYESLACVELHHVTCPQSTSTTTLCVLGSRGTVTRIQPYF